jgi:hypothetical protein
MAISKPFHIGREANTYKVTCVTIKEDGTALHRKAEYTLPAVVNGVMCNNRAQLLSGLNAWNRQTQMNTEPGIKLTVPVHIYMLD